MSFEPVGRIAGRLVARMAEGTERERKLAMIARLTADELRGWLWARRYDGRAWHEGELEALQRRAWELGVKL
ncbi:hypothetical protein [Pukyongiella litopenaei]|uniref:Uncharacterized protein n=1 Tax=Pukyongiella litopenaei TaxID=2605946 RepID=A0A5C2H277_9RHOB|nr:hypothetical protein [Pukyongiella litopenaei]QEP30300.1 hypothetical protein C6Y53_18895 [Pukyongiella litopenaei]